MKIKVFTAETMQEVMAKVKDELGIDAVILHTRRFHKGGIFGYLGKDMIEVTAAVEDKPPVKPVVKPPESVTAPVNIMPKNIVKKYTESGSVIPDVQEVASAENAAVENAAAQPAEVSSSSNGTEITPVSLPSPEDMKIKVSEESALAQSPVQPVSEVPVAETKSEAKPTPEPTPADSPPKRVFKRKVRRRKVEEAPEPSPPREETAETTAQTVTSSEKPQEKDSQIEQLQQELSDMKKMLEQVISTKVVVQPESVSLQRLLQDNEIEPEIAEEICSSILDEAVLANKDTPETKDFLSDYFEKTFRPAKGIDVSRGKSKVVAFIGATGVGKTTTIAKVAAKFVLEQAASVALITADTYRISAVDQLKTYSDIVGVPLEIVYTPEELNVAIAKHSDKELILLDTAGRSQHNQYQLNELKELLAVNADIEKHLVISATTKYRDAVDILRKFAICDPDKILFTKVDETSSLGTIINLAYHYPITLSYLTNGQSVPDDIAIGDSECMAKMLLR